MSRHTESVVEPEQETFYDPEANFVFKVLSVDEETSYCLWARRNHQPGGEINLVWHPMVRNECRKIDTEATREDPTDS